MVMRLNSSSSLYEIDTKLYPAAANCLAKSLPCSTPEQNTTVFLGAPNTSWVFLTHSVTMSPVIFMPRSDTSAADHSPATFFAPVMSISLAMYTLSGHRNPLSISFSVGIALTTLVYRFASPLVNGVALSPTTLMLGFSLMYSMTDW